MKIPFKWSRHWEILLDFFLILLFSAALIRPFFRAAYLDKWASIESSFIADARFLMEHWPHPHGSRCGMRALASIIFIRPLCAMARL